MKNILVNLLVAIVSTSLTFFFLQKTNSSPQETSIPTQATVQLVNQDKENPLNTKPQNRSFDAIPLDFTAIADKATQAVVNITALSSTGYQLSSGSGVIMDSEGYIITNHHVVEDGSRFEIALSDKRKFDAEFIGSDRTTDLALLKIDASNLVAMRYGNSDRTEVGQWVLAVGNPLNLTSTVTAGIVSAKARNINILRGNYSIESFIQTDAVVNPGNSGGALINTDGELVGINTAIISESGGYEGYSFAIPSNLVRKVVMDIKDYGKVQRAILGVGIGEVDERIARENGLPNLDGVVITNVTNGSSAARAGIRRGDVITAVNGISTKSIPELQEQVALYRPGDRISIEYYRRGRKYRKNDIVLRKLSSTTNN